MSGILLRHCMKLKRIAGCSNGIKSIPYFVNIKRPIPNFKRGMGHTDIRQHVDLISLAPFFKKRM
jgi:hypothetical protein